MKPEKALEIADDALTKALKTSIRARKAFDKKLGRLKLVEEALVLVESMMRENAKDEVRFRVNIVFYEMAEYSTMLEELQSALAKHTNVVAEIEKEMSE